MEFWRRTVLRLLWGMCVMFCFAFFFSFLISVFLGTVRQLYLWGMCPACLYMPFLSCSFLPGSVPSPAPDNEVWQTAPGAAVRPQGPPCASPCCSLLLPPLPPFSLSAATPSSCSRSTPLPKINNPAARKGSRRVSHISQKFNTEVF